MTSLMPPTVYATRLATQAQQSLQSATSVLGAPLALPVDGLVGIPEQSGPDSPDNPWFVSPKPRGSFAIAAEHAANAVKLIDSVLELGATDRLARDVISAFSNAREQAQVGVMQLTAKSMHPVDPRDVVLTFDGASLWLDLAKNLIELHDGPFIHPRPSPIR